MRIFFAGLGTMGAPMAKNLLAKGYALTVYNRSSKPLAWFREQGVEVASSPAEGAKEADVIVTMLSDDAAVDAVLGGEDEGCLATVRPGTLVIDSSTVSPELVRALSRKFAARGAIMLDAPVTGSAPQARDGILTFMVGGPEEGFLRARPLFLAMGRNALHVGPSGAGSTVKLANNTMAALNMLAVAEGLSIVQRSGLDPEQFLDVIAGGGANNGMAVSKREKLLTGRFPPDFAARLMVKDLRLATNLSWELGVPLPGLALVASLYQMACQMGEGDSDVAGLLKIYGKLSGSGTGEA
nr:NAD(P)-dependent oxidoreductase [Sulfobacillus harzensis]